MKKAVKIKTPPRKPAAQGQLTPEVAYGFDTHTKSRRWHQKMYQRSLRLALISLLIAGFSISGNILQYLYRPAPVYFSVSSDLRVIPLRPLSEPTVKDSELANWTEKQISGTLNLDFLHWREDLMSHREAYTEKAFSSFLASLKDSGVLELITRKRLSMSASATSAPVITASKVLKGVMTWRVEFPIKITYESSQGVEKTQTLIAKALVQRVREDKNPLGIKIVQTVLR